MDVFNSSLLREKFVIHDKDAHPADGAKPVIALSCRMEIELKAHGKEPEEFVVRAHNMHLCVRLVARMIQTYQANGPLLPRDVPFDWDAVWEILVNEYEYAYNPARWIAVYHKGNMIYKQGRHHPLLDAIEKCAIINKSGVYDESVVMAEKMFGEVGKNVRIEHDANVALVVSFEDNSGRCAIILRGANRTTTFNFSARGTREKPINIPQCLGASAAFLEGIQLAFLIGMNNEKIRVGVIERHSKEEKQTREAKKRLGRLSAEILNLENAFKVRYRPERPEFQQIVIEAEGLAQKVVKPPPTENNKNDGKDDILIH